MREAGIRLNAVESASASVAVGAMTLTVRYRAGLRPVAGSNRCVNWPAASKRKPAPAVVASGAGDVWASAFEAGQVWRLRAG